MTRLPRRRLLQLAAATAGAGVLAAPGRAHAAPARAPAAQPQQAVAQDANSFARATRAGFVPIASTLTFGAPIDIASGWDGSVWAVADPRSPAYDDPDGVNLHAARTYAGAALFTAAEQQQNQPDNIASAIQTMTKAIGVGGHGGGLGAAWVQPGTPRLGGAKYLPYADLPGSSYSAINAAGSRPAVVLQPVGLAYESNDDDSAPASFGSGAPATAAAAIDAQQGQAWVSKCCSPTRTRWRASSPASSPASAGTATSAPSGSRSSRAPTRSATRRRPPSSSRKAWPSCCRSSRCCSTARSPCPTRSSTASSGCSTR